MDKHAYLIIAHNQFELLETLIEMLDDARNDIYIHIDAKVKDFDFRHFQNLPKYSKLMFTDRISITWGDFSQIQAEMILFKTAVSNEERDNPYSYLHLLSGVDLPIKSNDEIHSFFKQNAGKEFVHFTSDNPDDDFSGRLRYYHLFRKKRNTFNKILAQLLLQLQKLVGVNRLKDKNIRIQKGSNWVSITGAFAHYIVSKENEINKMFAHTYCCDEVFIQTLLVNSVYKDNLYMPDCMDNQLACARLVDWQRGNPYIFRESDFDEIIHSSAMFARKFSLDDKRIICKIKNYVGEKL